MKSSLLIFAAGGAAGALIMWFLKPGPELGAGGAVSPSAVAATKAHDELANQKTARVQVLEKELKDLKSSMEGTPSSIISGLSAPAMSPANEKIMQDLETRQDEKEVNREVDRLTLRLNLAGDQKAALRKFLTDGKEKQREAIKAVTNGGFPESPSPEDFLTEEEFLKGILTAEQRAEYARAAEEWRRTRAEDFAQRKVRKLNHELNLSEQQKDKLFQAYAQQKLEATDPAKKAADDDTAPLPQGVVVDEVVVGIDRKAMEAILTTEQLAVYDRRQKEENEQMSGIIRVENGFTIEDLPVPLPTGDEDDEDDDAGE